MHTTPPVGNTAREKRTRKLPYVLTGAAGTALGALIVGAAVAGSASDPDTRAPAPAPVTTTETVTVTMEPASTEAVHPPIVADDELAEAPDSGGTNTTVSSGTYEVGVDIEAGRYKTGGPDRDDYLKMCYWERATDDSGELASIITNGTSQGPASLTVNTGEFVTFTGSCVWKRQ